MDEILIIVIERSGGKINSLRDLALFLKRNLNLKDFEITSEEPGLLPFTTSKSRHVVRNAVRYGDLVNFLRSAFDLSRSEAEKLIEMLESAGWIKIETLIPDIMLGIKDTSIVSFCVD